MTFKVFDRTKLPNWDPVFTKRFLGFAPLIPFWETKANACPMWPTCFNWQDWASSIPEVTVRFVEAAKTHDYETQLYHYHEVMTRPENWHDFLNNMTWCVFPQIKKALFERMQAAWQRVSTDQCHTAAQTLRTPLQNVLAHFDECGVIVCASDEQCLDWLRQGKWKQFFFETKDITSRCEPVIFGHGLYEKALKPYVGLTGKAILLNVSQTFFTLTMPEKIAFIDKQLSDIIRHQNFITDPKCLQPFPILGWPNWDHNNRHESYYDNQQVFRTQSGRRVPILDVNSVNDLLR